MRRTDFSGIKHLDWRSLISLNPKEEAQPGDVERAEATLEKYFAPFAALPDPVEKDGKKVAADFLCIGCEMSLTPGLLGWVKGGGFTWGLAHGEGTCANCHWPCRAHHYVKHDDGTSVFNLQNFVLAYHPDQIDVEKWKAGQPAPGEDGYGD